MLQKINRYKEILSIFVRYGFADWVSRINLDLVKELCKNQKGENLDKFSHEEKVRLAITELGPTFIKLGQILSTRSDLIGKELALELKKLQSSVPADSDESVRKTIEEDLGNVIEGLFDDFNFAPIGSASIGQVHTAKIKTGEEVVIKIQHENIKEKITTDLEILLDLADLMEKYIEESKNYRPVKTCEEFKRILMKELDFRWEKRNLKKFTDNFSKNVNLKVPKVFDSLCSDRVLTMEKIEGIPISETDKLTELGYDLKELSIIGANVFLQMIFEHGFYHADPHPGNIFVIDNKKIGLIDCGMVGRIDEELRDDIEDLLICIATQNGRKMIDIICRIGSIPADLDKNSLQNEVMEFVEFYSSMPIKDLNINKALEEMTSIVRRYNIILPTRISLMLKVLIMLEGTSRALNPDFDITSLLKTYKSKMILRRLSFSRQKRAIVNFYNDIERLIHILPDGLYDLLKRLQEGRFVIQLESKRMENAINRLVFGLITSALFIGSSLLMVFKTPPIIFNTSAFGLVGYLISTIFGLRLLWAIYLSGNLERND